MILSFRLPFASTFAYGNTGLIRYLLLPYQHNQTDMKKLLLIAICLVAALADPARNEAAVAGSSSPAQIQWNKSAASLPAASTYTVTIACANDNAITDIFATGLVAQDGTPYPALESDNGYTASVPPANTR